MLVGKGAMGVVWRAEDLELNLDIALKFLAEEFLFDANAIADLKRETRRGMALAHPNIVRIFGFFHAEHYAAIAMEYVEGNTLATLQGARHEPFFEVEELAEWVRQLCSALDYAHHEALLVHRDLKPGNLMIDARGRMKVADFGIAGELEAAHTRVAGTNDTRGTLSYMSPQQLLGQRPSIDHDIYSLGATLYDLITGRPAFSTGDISLQVRTVVPPPLAVRRAENGYTGAPIPAAWEETIAACLAKDASQRPASAAELAEKLGLGKIGSGPRSPQPRPKAPSPTLPVASGAPTTLERPTVAQPAAPGSSPRAIAPTVLGTRESPPSGAIVVTPGTGVEARPSVVRRPGLLVGLGIGAVALIALIIGLAVYWGARLAREPAPAVAKKDPAPAAAPARGGDPADFRSEAERTAPPFDEKRGPPPRGMIKGPDGQRRPAPFGTPPRFAPVDISRAPLDQPVPEHPIKFPATGLQFVWVPPGNNAVGVPALAEGPAPNEYPVTDVVVTKGFWLAKYEVTRGQFTNVMGSNPSALHLGAEYPVSNVTWDEAMQFCRQLTERERAAGRLGPDLEFTLPTEAEWEYAAKCGFVGPFGSHETVETAAWGSWSGVETPQPVGKREANGWALHDMFGNVAELCRDWYADKRPGGRVEDYPGPKTGTHRLYKGGSFKDSSFMMRASVRSPLAPEARDPRVGFRLALVQARQDK